MALVLCAALVLVVAYFGRGYLLVCYANVQFREPGAAVVTRTSGDRIQGILIEVCNAAVVTSAATPDRPVLVPFVSVAAVDSGDRHDALTEWYDWAVGASPNSRWILLQSANAHLRAAEFCRTVGLVRLRVSSQHACVDPASCWRRLVDCHNAVGEHLAAARALAERLLAVDPTDPEAAQVHAFTHTVLPP